MPQGAAPVRPNVSREMMMSANVRGRLTAILGSALLLGGCRASDAPVRVVGPISSNEVGQIASAVRSYNLRWFRSMEGHPIRSIQVLSNGTVEVWFAAKEFRWGEAGNILRKGTNGWQITTELFR